MERVKLYKDLYCASRSACEPYWRQDTERVKETRDLACMELFGKHYSELSDSEILFVIEELNSKTATKNRLYASPKQRRLMQSYAITCGLYYCNLEGMAYYDRKNDTMYNGRALRDYLKKCFDEKTGIPNNIMRQLYERWINPKSHQLLEQGGFRKPAKKPERFFYEYLTPEEARYLINRYREISMNISRPNTSSIIEEEAVKN